MGTKRGRDKGGAFGLRTVAVIRVLATLIAVAAGSWAIPAEASALPVDCAVTATCVPSASITGVSPAVDEPTTDSLLTVSGRGLDNVTTLRVGDIVYSRYPCPPALPARSRTLAGARIAAAGCDPASPSDLTRLQFAVYDDGQVIETPDPVSASNEGAQVTLPEPGSTVSVTGVVDGQTMPSTASYSFPVGTLSLDGPLTWKGVVDSGEDAPLGGAEWSQGQGRSLSVPVPSAQNALTFTTTSPVLHVWTTFDNSGNNERPPGANDPNGVETPNETPWKVGTGGTYAAELFWCKPDVGAVPQGTATACKDWQGDPGQWTGIGFRVSRLQKIGSENDESTADLAFPITSVFSAQQLAGTFEIATSAYETDPSACAGDCTTGPSSLPSDGEPCVESYPDGVYGYPNSEYFGPDSGTLQRDACLTTKPFNIVIEPAALLQVSALPYSILYFPPGDASTSKQTFGNNFSTNYTLNNSSMQSNSYSTESSGSTGFSLSLSFEAGFSVGQTSGWSTTDTAGVGLSRGSSAQSSQAISFSGGVGLGPDQSQVPGNGLQCASATNCAPADYIKPSDQYQNEPFWKDVFELEVRPQFAVYDLGAGPDEYVARGADPDLAAYTVTQLDECASGVNLGNDSACTVAVSTQGLSGQGLGQQSNPGTVTITPADASNLLKLDPFFLGGQDAQISPSRGLPVSGGQPYGSVFSPVLGSLPYMSTTPVADNALSYSPALSNTLTTMSSASGSQSYSASITNVVSNMETEGASVDVGEDGTKGAESITLQSGDQRTTMQSANATFGNSTAVSGSEVTSDMATINDVDNTSPGGGGSAKAHNPLPEMPNVRVYLDRQFGGFLFQDAGAPGPPPAGLTKAQIGQQVLNLLAIKAEWSGSLSGVSPSSPLRGAIASAVGLGILSPEGNAFRPNAPLTQSQLASALAAVFHVPPAQTRRRFTDPAASAGAAVTEAELASALSAAFKVGSTSGRQLVIAGTPVFKSPRVVTRASAAAALDAAVERDCLTGCALPPLQAAGAAR